MRELVHEVSGLETTEEVETSARSQLYLLLSDSFQIPDNEFYTDVKSGQFRNWISDAMTQLPYELAAGEAVERLSADVDFDTFNSEFMGLFEVGNPQPSCPLYESLYVGAGQLNTFREMVSFYNFFDLSVSKARERPDHLRIQLEFMHFLTFKEIQRAHGGRENGSYLKASRDFLDRHLNKWLPLLRQGVEEADGLEFYQGLTLLLEAFTREESKFLAQTLAPGFA
jgi:DMSO reductase family type II enzyme chaperone